MRGRASPILYLHGGPAVLPRAVAQAAVAAPAPREDSPGRGGRRRVLRPGRYAGHGLPLPRAGRPRAWVPQHKRKERIGPPQHLIRMGVGARLEGGPWEGGRAGGGGGRGRAGRGRGGRGTCVGSVRSTRVPSPRFPYRPQPQLTAPPDSSAAMPCSPPAATLPTGCPCGAGPTPAHALSRGPARLQALAAPVEPRHTRLARRADSLAAAEPGQESRRADTRASKPSAARQRPAGAARQCSASAVASGAADILCAGTTLRADCSASRRLLALSKVHTRTGTLLGADS